MLLRHARCELGLSLHSILSPPDSTAQHSKEAGPPAHLMVLRRRSSQVVKEARCW